ncbi:PHP domain-containing protein [Candidatus Pacearchaeota archaeon]|nr:PHP domain-containing protein [Candidatus Pacearchaeota archaeon]
MKKKKHNKKKNKKSIKLKIIFLAILAVILIIVAILTSPVNNEERYYTGNLHTHTYASDGKMSYEEIINESLNLGFDFIAITDHNTIGKEVKEKCPQEKRILCIMGEEISTTKGHMLAIGIKEAVPKGLSPEETISKIHSQNGLAIPAHPERKTIGLKIEEIKNLDIDAVECHVNDKGEYNFSCDLLNLPKVYNSDAHNKEQLKILANICIIKNLNLESLKEAIKENKCSQLRVKSQK